MADIPDLTVFAKELEHYTPTTQAADTTQTADTVIDTDLLGGADTADTAQARLAEDTDAYPGMPATKLDAAVLSVPVVGAQAVPDDLVLPNKRVIKGGNLKAIYDIAIAHRAAGLSRTRIVKEHFGFVGANYQSGVHLYKALGELFGTIS